MVSTSLKTGDHVKYRAVGGGPNANIHAAATGVIVDVLTKSQPEGDSGVTVKASEQKPRYLIRNDHTGKETAYKSENIIGSA